MYKLLLPVLGLATIAAATPARADYYCETIVFGTPRACPPWRYTVTMQAKVTSTILYVEGENFQFFEIPSHPELFQFAVGDPVTLDMYFDRYLLWDPFAYVDISFRANDVRITDMSQLRYFEFGREFTEPQEFGGLYFGQNSFLYNSRITDIDINFDARGPSNITLVDSFNLDYEMRNIFGQITITYWGPTDYYYQSIAFSTEWPGRDGVVPEPATWAMMIAGFGMVGATLRRRRISAA